MAQALRSGCRWRQWVRSAGLALALLASGLQPAVRGQVPSGGLPNLGDGEDMSVAAERRMGQRIAREIYRDPDYVDDPVLGDYLQAIWQPLLASARARGELSAEMAERYAWTPMLVRDRTVNAFALPGGYLGVHLGLIALVTSRDELASVLGHELTHVTQRHIARLTTRQNQQAPWVMGAMILGALAARRSADAANAAIAGSQAVAMQGQLNFSRDMEREADRIGYAVMTGAGFDGRGFVGMFDKLQHANRINDNGSYPYLRSHPLTTERIADAQLRVSQEGSSMSSPAASAMEPLLMGARARVLADPGVEALRGWVNEATSPALAGALASQPPGRQAAALYAAVMAKLRLKAPEGMPALLARLAALTAQDADASRAAGLLAAEVALALGEPQRALLLLPPASQSRSVVLMSAQAMAATGRGGDLAQAAESLQTWVASHADDALAWQTLAGVYQRQGLPARAARADAESRVAQLDFRAAADRLRAGQVLLRQTARNGPADDIEAAIIDTRLRQVDSLFREQALER